MFDVKVIVLFQKGCVKKGERMLNPIGIYSNDLNHGSHNIL